MSASALPALPSVKKLSEYVTRILGQNPGKFTLQGTNTYLVHHPTSPSLILLDTAQGLPAYLPHLRSSVKSHPVQPARVTDILLSHWHHDHVDGLDSVLEELDRIGAVDETDGVRVWKFPATGGEEDKNKVVERRLERVTENVVQRVVGDEVIEGGRRVRALRDGQTFRLGRGVDDGVELEVVHTPGHTTDAISLVLRTRDPSRASPDSKRRVEGLFSFDTVLGHGTAVFNDLTTYLSSLTRLILLVGDRNRPSGSTDPSVPSGSRAEPSSAEAHVPIFPGHGEVIEDGLAKLREYKRHRLEREQQVVDALAKVSKPTSAISLTRSIYGTTIPESLVPAATRGLLLHLSKLEHDGKVDRIRGGATRGVDGTGADEETGREEVDWDKLGVSEKDVPEHWDARWRLVA
ncbi:hypothetical protein JCM10212_001445 [Sporobolomyces blumeae]